MKIALDVFWNKHSNVWVLVQSVHNEYMHSWCFITRLLSSVVITVAAPIVWNSLPAHLHSTLISRRQFRDGLKSHLFADAYFWSSENIRYKSVMYLLTYILTELLLLPLLDMCGCRCCSCCWLFLIISWTVQLICVVSYLCLPNLTYIHHMSDYHWFNITLVMLNMLITKSQLYGKVARLSEEPFDGAPDTKNSMSSVLYRKLCFYQVQQVSGSADDTLVCTEGLCYNSDVVKDWESAWKHQSFWLDNFITGYGSPRKCPWFYTKTSNGRKRLVVNYFMVSGN